MTLRCQRGYLQLGLRLDLTKNLKHSLKKRSLVKFFFTELHYRNMCFMELYS